MSTTKLEDFFNLSPADDEPDADPKPVISRDELFAEAKSIYSSLSTAEKVNCALPLVTGLEQHDTEMDVISAKATSAFEQLMNLGGNVADMHAGKIYEVAGQMLKTVLEANNSKADKKLKLIELQLKKIRSEQVDASLGDNTNGPGPSNNEFDRNELLKHLVSYDKSDEK